MLEPASSDHPVCLHLVLTCPEGGPPFMAEAGKTLQLTDMQGGSPRHYMVSWTEKLIYPGKEELL